MYATERVSTRVKALGILAAGAFVLGSLGVVRIDAQQSVSWTNQANVKARGDVIEKVGGCQGCEDAGAVSQQMMQGDGYAEFTVGEPYTFLMVGLARLDGSVSFNGIDYGIRFNGNGSADVMENGEYANGSDTDYVPGDRFRVAVVNGHVQYSKNDHVFYVSRRGLRLPLVLATSLGTIGATVRNARIDTDGRALTYDRSVSTNRPDETDRLATLDRNRKADLSRRELPRGGAVDTVGTSAQLIIVEGTQAWTDTGIWVEAGDLITFDAEGRVQLSDDPRDIASPAGVRSGRREDNVPLRAQPAGALIVRIGDSAASVAVVGAHRTSRAPMTGELFLGINDDYMADNNGQFRVTVTVQPR